MLQDGFGIARQKSASPAPGSLHSEPLPGRGGGGAWETNPRDKAQPGSSPRPSADLIKSKLRDTRVMSGDGECLTFRERAEVMIQNNLPKGAGGAGQLWSMI